MKLDDEFFIFRYTIYEFLAAYLDIIHYGALHSIPEYDLICLDNLLNYLKLEEGTLPVER